MRDLFHMTFVDVITFGVPVLVLAGAALAARYFSRDARLRRALKARRRIDIGAAPDGATVKISGRVSLVGEPLVAPVSGRPCAAWEVVVERVWHSGAENERPEVLVHDWAAQSFLLDDGTGRALVEVCVPKIVLRQDVHLRSGTFTDASGRLEAFLAQHDVVTEGLDGRPNDLRFTEGAIEAGETVSALGKVRHEPDPDGAAGAGYRSAPMRVVLGDPDDEDMLLSDDVPATK